MKLHPIKNNKEYQASLKQAKKLNILLEVLVCNYKLKPDKTKLLNPPKKVATIPVTLYFIGTHRQYDQINASEV